MTRPGTKISLEGGGGAKVTIDGWPGTSPADIAATLRKIAAMIEAGTLALPWTETAEPGPES